MKFKYIVTLSLCVVLALAGVLLSLAGFGFLLTTDLWFRGLVDIFLGALITTLAVCYFKFRMEKVF